MRRNASTSSLTLSLFSILCTCWANGSILDGWGLVFQVAEIVRFLTYCAIRIAVVVAGLLSVPGLRHVGAQYFMGAQSYMGAQYLVMRGS